jgi:predicted lipoprotein with Yx(FWY)xxD motif
MKEVHDQGSIRAKALSGAAAGVIALASLSLSLLTAGPSGAASAPSVRLTVIQTPDGRVLAVGTAPVYTLQANATACAAACLHIWPAVMLPQGAKHATAGSGVSSSKLGTAKMTGGARQVTYSGKRLFTFVYDTPGHVNGNITDTWGKWTVVVLSKSGAHAAASPPKSTTSTSSNAGSGGASF